MLVLFGQSSGPVPAFEPKQLAAGSLFLTRPALHHYTATRKELELRAGEVLAAVQGGALRLRIHAALPLDRVADAHRLLESRQTSGKLLLVP
jgi:NADPH2:quinone reductase